MPIVSNICASYGNPRIAWTRPGPWHRVPFRKIKIFAPNGPSCLPRARESARVPPRPPEPAADTALFTVPNQLGVACNARILDTIARHVAPAIGWTAAQAATAA